MRHLQQLEGDVFMSLTPPSSAVRSLWLMPAIALLGGCATLGSMMSPYSEKFSCKNDDHGQCIHPERAYEEAVAGIRSKSDPRVTNEPSPLGKSRSDMRRDGSSRQGSKDAWVDYRDSVYQELKGLIDAPVTPMLKPARAVRTLILPYADRLRPDRLYMPRYVYSVVGKPLWVVGGSFTASPPQALQEPVLKQNKDALPADSAASPLQPAQEERP